MILSALRLPGNVEQMLADIQTHLFRTLGLLSARALPPLIPLAWSTAPVDLGVVPPAPLPPLRFGEAVCVGSRVVVPLDPEAPLDSVSRTLAAHAGAPSKEAPFPIGTPAIFLALSEDRSPAELTDTLTMPGTDPSAGQAVRGTVVRSFSLVNIDVELWRQNGGLQVRWSEHSRRKLRKHRD